MVANTIEFESVLRSSGYKLTAQRQALLEIIEATKGRHLCTEEIFDEVRKNFSSIGLATVYRNLQLFEKLGLVHHILLGDGCMRFQIIDAQEKHRHHHLVCEICSGVMDVEEDMLETIEKKLLLEMGFTVRDHKVQFFGICKECAKEEIRKDLEEK
ncbi:Fur family transcriptional regulator [Desulfoscipio sp. XC116]|uniref:Fur family transcriptional regulator n=1 Tax=Desulfoscipio sp. XC116 TaxID=3144975 RepID=UPI00325BCB08